MGSIGKSRKNTDGAENAGTRIDHMLPDVAEKTVSRVD